jgi:nucleoside-diphosphate-sugar epimerase
VRILLTGASSFTGLWFARALRQAGHEVILPLRGEAGSYVDGVRADRVRALAAHGEVVWDCRFGTPRFLDLAASGHWDLLCHHAARVGDYRAADFDISGALAENTLAFPEVLAAMRGLRGVVLTGSVFEADEGAGSRPHRAFSPYGLSKGLTAQVVRHWCEMADLPLGRFVIPNPFGPYEEPRFGAYLLRCFLRGEAPEVRTPLYVRDNIHVDVLAARYATFCATLSTGTSWLRLNPSGYVESQGSFAQRFAREMSTRLDRPCEVRLGTQTDFSEPLMRINTDPAAAEEPGWDEAAAWDAIAEFYAPRRGGNPGVKT